MTVIKFKRGNIFDVGIGKYDLCLFYGHHGMAFGLGYSIVQEKYEVFRNIESPFTLMPNTPITYLGIKSLVCIPNDYMSDDEIRNDLIAWLEFAKQNEYKSIASTGVRNSSNIGVLDIELLRQNDDDRVRFIVQILEEWLRQNNSKIENVLLIAMSDNFTRNYNAPVNVITL